MDKRLQLQTLLEETLGSRNVYFQPPATVQIKYPCIIYSRGVVSKVRFANDGPYNIRMRYVVTVIDQDPDSEIPGRVDKLPLCIFERHHTKDNLNHDIYNLYY